MYKEKINKIKVTKQVIITYTVENDIRPYSFSQTFLNQLLSPSGTFEISQKNANVTWYSRIDKSQTETKEAINESQTDETDESKNDLELNPVDELINDGYDFTLKAEEIAKEKGYTIEQLKAVSKDKKITTHSLKKID